MKHKTLSTLSIFILFLIINISCVESLKPLMEISSMEQLAKYHCKQFPIETLYRIASGRVSQKYGSSYSQFDCYVRQFVSNDGQGIEVQQDEDQQQQGEAQQEQEVPQEDAMAVEYGKGLQECLPQGVDPTQAVYAMWRLYRYLIQHDYAYEWMRAKIRSCYGYEAQKPNSWMDGQQSVERLKLNKLFSNQFYDHVDNMMFKDFLFPIMTLLRENVIIAVNGSLTRSGKPLLGQFIRTKNYVENQVIIPVRFNLANHKQFFAYTIPGVPLLLAGASDQLSWAFSGILVDRSNIQEIQTVGNKFYHHDTQVWIRLQRRNISIPVKDQEPYMCSYMFSAYGTLYQKKNSSGKVSEYISRWRQDQARVRNIFTWMLQTVQHGGNLPVKKLEFPFSSLVIANLSGIYNYISPQIHPSYFIYPDMSQEPEQIQNRWVQTPKRGYFVIQNSHLSTVNVQNYFEKQPLSSIQQEYILKLRKVLKQSQDKTISLEHMYEVLMNLNVDAQISKIKDLLVFMYRKSKFLFLQDDKIRKECDQLIAMVDSWDNQLNSVHSPVLKLWYFYFKKLTFSYGSQSQLGRDIIRFRALTNSYWVNQLQLWKVGTSYGECDCPDWNDLRQKYNGSSLNSTCFYNIVKAINATRLELQDQSGQFRNQLFFPKAYSQKKVLQLKLGEDSLLVGTNIQQAMEVYYSRNLAFAAEVGAKVIYHRGYSQKLAIYQMKTTSESIIQEAQDTILSNPHEEKIIQNDQEGQL